MDHNDLERSIDRRFLSVIILIMLLEIARNSGSGLAVTASQILLVGFGFWAMIRLTVRQSTDDEMKASDAARKARVRRRQERRIADNDPPRAT